MPNGTYGGVRGEVGNGLTYSITWRRPIFPGSCLPSIVGPGGLNFRVRYGNGWTPSGMVTRKAVSSQLSADLEIGLSKLHKGSLWASNIACFQPPVTSYQHIADS